MTSTEGYPGVRTGQCADAVDIYCGGREWLACGAERDDSTPFDVVVIASHQPIAAVPAELATPALYPGSRSIHLASEGVLRAATRIFANEPDAGGDEVLEAIDLTHRCRRVHAREKGQVDGIDIAESGDTSLIQQRSGECGTWRAS